MGARRNYSYLATAVTAVSLALVGLPTGAGSHSDGVYDQPVWFQWGERVLDTLIVPAERGPIFNGNGVLGGNPVAELGPCTNSYTRAMKQSALDWKVAVNAYAPAWLQALVINVYVLGCDPTPPTSALTDPEILVIGDENKGPILGVTFSTKPCLILDSQMFIEWMTYNDMYSVAGHEFGHCMGLDHVQDEHPDADILDATVDEGIGGALNPRHCPSNLNVNTMKGSFAFAFGQSGAGVKGTVAVGSYAQIAC